MSKIVLTMETLIIRAIQSGLSINETTKMIEVIYSDRKAKDNALELYQASEKAIFKFHFVNLHENDKQLLNKDSINGTEFANHVARKYHSIYCS